MLVCIIKRQQELGGELGHDFGGNPVVREPAPKASQCLAHDLKDKAHMVSVGALMLEVVDEMANVLVARLGPISITEMCKNLPLEDGLARDTIGHGAQHFESAELLLLVGTAAFM